jgi:hypothetical protein
MSNITLPKEEFVSLLEGVSKYIEMTKEASNTISHNIDSSNLEGAIYSLCSNGLLPIEKRAQIIDDIKDDPNKICTLIEKLASRVGPSSLGDSDSTETDGRDASSIFEQFCLS